MRRTLVRPRRRHEAGARNEEGMGEEWNRMETDISLPPALHNQTYVPEDLLLALAVEDEDDMEVSQLYL